MLFLFRLHPKVLVAQFQKYSLLDVAVKCSHTNTGGKSIFPRRCQSCRSVFDDLEKTMPDFKEQFRSITTDNGSEFLVLEELQRSIHGGKRFDVWYCHSYSAWEKGSNENQNRMIRRWFPKGTDFSKVTKKQVADIQEWMNNYPRRILGWNTPNEMRM